MLFARRGRGKPRVLEQIAAVHELCEFYPSVVAQIGYTQGEVAVRHGNRLVADLDADKMFMEFADHETEQRFLHRYNDSLTFAGALARMKRSEDAAYHADTGGFVADADRFGSRRAAIVPSCVRPAGHAVVGMRRAAVVFVGTRLAEAARAGVDHARIDFFQVPVAQAKFFHLPGVVVLDDDIGFGNQLPG